MEDRFRFRAWNKRYKRMIYNAEDVYDGSLSGFCENEDNNNDGHISCFGEYLGRDDEYIIMQCTGVKDRNGKLIYEEDIIKYTDCEGKETIGSLAIDRFNLLTFANMVNCDFCEEWADVVKAVFFTGNSTIEVIGNIYENKELLGEQK